MEQSNECTTTEFVIREQLPLLRRRLGLILLLGVSANRVARTDTPEAVQQVPQQEQKCY